MTVQVEYIGDTTKAFDDATAGEALSNKMYDNGACIIYHAAGDSGNGLFKAAAEQEKIAIGVDSDQHDVVSADQAAWIMTSMIKRVDTAVYDTIAAVAGGTFKGGGQVFGLADEGISYATSNPELMSQDIVDQVEAYKQKILDGDDQGSDRAREVLRTEGIDAAMDDGAGAGRVSAPPLVVMEGITKRFPGVLANDDVTIDLRPGEVHALIGENGAGKSTLMRVLYGLYPPNEGRITIRGKDVKIASPRDAIALGIGMVHQHFVLVDPFTVAENIILGDGGRSDPRQGGVRGEGRRAGRRRTVSRSTLRPSSKISRSARNSGSRS